MTEPAYVMRPGESCHLQPYLCRNTQLYGFFLDCDADTIQAKLVDPILNAPTGGALTYKVLSGTVLVSYALAAQGTSTLPPDSGFGWVPENSWTVWVPLVLVKPGVLFDVEERLVFYPAWICVDNTWSLAAGREVYGFPKQYGPMTVPPPGTDAASFGASTLVLETYAPQNTGSVQPLMTITRTETGSEAGEIWTDIGDAVKAIAHMWTGGTGKLKLPGLDFILDVLKIISHREVPGVFLKQFRDAADGRNACYQAIVEAPSSVNALHHGGLLTGHYQATVHDYASHPVATTLGLAPGIHDLKFPYWVNMDFTIGNGTNVWSSANG